MIEIFGFIDIQDIFSFFTSYRFFQDGQPGLSISIKILVSKYIKGSSIHSHYCLLVSDSDSHNLQLVTSQQRYLDILSCLDFPQQLPHEARKDIAESPRTPN